MKVDVIIYGFYCRIGKACLKELRSAGLASSSTSPLISPLTPKIFKKSSAFGQGGRLGLVQRYAMGDAESLTIWEGAVAETSSCSHYHGAFEVTELGGAVDGSEGWLIACRE